jgi:aspartyl-tRNA(Asn)/glutamyl-tRNA(Gln) amidotransferase subunit A
MALKSLVELSREILAGRLKPTELVEETLERIVRVNPKINAFITVLSGQAFSAAAAAERELEAGRYRGPLHGIPVSVKDIIFVEGVRCTAGSKIMAHHIAPYDATVTRKLREAGAVIVGTNNLHEFASGVTSINPHYGPVRNPWNTRFIAGGSSGGSAAAVAAGLTSVSIGTDTSGSVRIPASLCGVVGLKPSFGRVSKHGVIPLSWSLDHIGILADTVADAAITLKTLAGYDPEDENSVYAEVPDYHAVLERGVDGLRACILKGTVPVDGEVASAFRKFVKVLEGLGMTVYEVEFEYAERVRECWAPIRLGEAAAFHDDWLRSRREDYGLDVRAMLERGGRYTAVDYVKAARLKHVISRSILRILDQYHAIISPTTPVTAVEIGVTESEIDGEKADIYTALTSHTILHNITGIPSISIPAGLSSRGLPIGIQIAGRLYDEPTILRIAHQAAKKLEIPKPPTI